MEGFGQTETTLTIANLRGSETKPGSMGTSVAPVQHRPGGRGRQLRGRRRGRRNRGPLHPGGPAPRHVPRATTGTRSCTAKAWRGGYYHTGDTAYRDEDGYFWYVGRTDDIIKSSGYRIGPFEVESVLMEHPAVLECAITGAPDPIRGQVVKATIVLTSKYTALRGAEKGNPELREEDHGALQVSPGGGVCGLALPKTISGKIRRVEIAQRDREKAKEQQKQE